jgi:hypothetical protein
VYRYTVELTRFKALWPVFVLAARAGVAQGLPKGRGRDAVQRVCSRCHAVTVILNQGHTRTEWADIVEEMENYGAAARRAEFRQIVDYLARNFPRK